MRTIALTLTAPTPESFAPFGVMPRDEGVEPTADLEFALNDGWVNFIGHTLDEIEMRGTTAQCELLNRHDTHTQTLMPMSGDAFAVVAPPDVDFSKPEHFDTVRAFALPQYTCVHLHLGTWHWGPYPIGAPALRIFNIQGRGYVNDNGIAWLTRDHGVVYEIETAS
ncbi:MAG TPA: ureidoglycolate lyase [Acidimicrobiia bacterium]|nr:ureidoglycolate lyase [Acidimicrobiia bacterium]